MWRPLLLAALALAAAAPAGGGAAPVQLAYLDKTTDRVGSGPQATPDGRPDGHFRLTVNANDTVIAITLRTSDASGQPCCGQVWNTIPADPFWILGVFRGGRQLNPTDRNISDPVAGSATYDIYGADSGFFNPGQRFIVNVDFPGRTCTAYATVGGPSTPGTCTAMPSAPPSGSATGTVLVNGSPFTTGPIPYGSTVDVTRGRVTLRVDVGTLTAFGDNKHPAMFRLTRTSERVKGKKQPLVQLALVGGNFAVCPRRSLSSAEQKPREVVRALWGRGKGKFRTKARYSAATVRGTIWLTADRCDGTLTQVKQGRVEVRDFTRRRTVQVRAGRSYLAPARR